MKRIYPALTEELKPYCVSHEDCAYRVVDGVVSASFLFEKTIPLLGLNPEPYKLDYSSSIDAVYVHIANYGIVRLNLDGLMMTMGMQTMGLHHMLVFHATLDLPVPGILDATIKLSINGAIGLRRSMADVDAEIVSHQGLPGVPELLGYDLKLYEAVLEEVTEAV